MQEKATYQVGLYLRLSKDDEQQGESVSIGTQRSILMDYCHKNNYNVFKVYPDDGYSGLNFNRPAFQEMLEDIQSGLIDMVITKDLSRLGRDYIMTGYYSEIYFPSVGVRYVALADDFDSLKGGNEIAPFKNILNDMYARDISKKVKNAKHQQAKKGLFIGGQAPFGYCKDPNNKHQLIIDPEAAAVVRLVFSLAEQGLGNIAIASQLKVRKVFTPSAYKYLHGEKRFAYFETLEEAAFYNWSYGTVGQMLNNRVYTGDLISLKSETTNCKTKQRVSVPQEDRIITVNAHEAIISQEQFDKVRQIRALHGCPANIGRYNLFRGKLFCECCGHPLSFSKKALKDREADMYYCMYHYRHLEVCPKTHRVYHEMLYPYVLQQIRNFARSMKRRKVNSTISEYATIEELTPQILDNVIERIEIGHVKRNSKPSKVIRIYWKLK